MELQSSLSTKIKEFVSAAFDDFRLEGGDEYTLQCPFHEDLPGKRKLYLNKNSGLWTCFKCEERGNFSKLVFKLAKDNKSIVPSEFIPKWSPPIDTGLARLGVAKPKVGASYRDVTPKGLVDLWTPIETHFIERQRLSALNYLASRGVSKLQAEFYQIRLGVMDRFAGRVLIPVIDPENQRPLGFVGRALNNLTTPKVLNTANIPGQKSIDAVPFSLDKALKLKYKEVVLVEGVFDAMKHGPNFLALLGKMKDPQRAAIVRAKFDKITVMLDLDAERECRHTAESLKMYCPNVFWTVVRDAKDPGDATPEQVKKALAAAKQVS